MKQAIAAWRNMARTDGISPSQLFYGRRQRQLLPLMEEQAKSQVSSTAGRDKTAEDSERLRNKHTTNYTELHKDEKVWMQHHITGKWNASVQVIRKRKDGNSYVVPAPDRNTYIRGRRLLKPISSPNTNPETTEEDTRTDIQDKKEPSVNSGEDKAMPRRSPRNHVSTWAADIEIAARLTAIYICDLDNGTEALSANRRRRGQSPNRQPHFHCVKLGLPSPGATWTDNFGCLPHGTGHHVNSLAGTLHLQDGQQTVKNKRGPRQRRSK